MNMLKISQDQLYHHVQFLLLCMYVYTIYSLRTIHACILEYYSIVYNVHSLP